jgi:hypothetical protein
VKSDLTFSWFPPILLNLNLCWKPTVRRSTRRFPRLGSRTTTSNQRYLPSPRSSFPLLKYSQAPSPGSSTSTVSSRGLTVKFRRKSLNIRRRMSYEVSGMATLFTTKSQLYLFPNFIFILLIMSNRRHKMMTYSLKSGLRIFKISPRLRKPLWTCSSLLPPSIIRRSLRLILCWNEWCPVTTNRRSTGRCSRVLLPTRIIVNYQMHLFWIS